MRLRNAAFCLLFINLTALAQQDLYQEAVILSRAQYDVSDLKLPPPGTVLTINDSLQTIGNLHRIYLTSPLVKEGFCQINLKSSIDLSQEGLVLMPPTRFTVTGGSNALIGWVLEGTSNNPMIKNIQCSKGLDNLALLKNLLMSAAKGTVDVPQPSED